MAEDQPDQHDKTDDKQSLLARIGTLEPAPPWNFAVALYAIIAATAAMIAASLLFGTLLEGQTVALLFGWCVGGVVTIFLVRRSRRRPADIEALRLTPPRAPLILLLLFNLGIAILLDLLSLGVTGAFLPVPELLPLTQTTGTGSLLIGVLFMIAIQPTAEELVFRGVALPALRTTFGAWLGLMICALASGFFHFVIYSPSSYAALFPETSSQAALWYAFALPTLAGLVFGINRAATGSTRAAFAAHSAFGLFAVLKLIVLLPG
jgi:membrane protease YdiL (CAAX protease family)